MNLQMNAVQSKTFAGNQFRKYPDTCENAVKLIHLYMIHGRS